jgi:hypothetical protein
MAGLDGLQSARTGPRLGVPGFRDAPAGSGPSVLSQYLPNLLAQWELPPAAAGRHPRSGLMP